MLFIIFKKKITFKKIFFGCCRTSKVSVSYDTLLLKGIYYNSYSTVYFYFHCLFPQFISTAYNK